MFSSSHLQHRQKKPTHDPKPFETATLEEEAASRTQLLAEQVRSTQEHVDKEKGIEYVGGDHGRLIWGWTFGLEILFGTSFNRASLSM